jgi:hypothetical protein
MGSAGDDTRDDGVRTGWVCVDVGVIDAPEVAKDDAPRDFVGFGRRTDGVRIVVQMLTEEKRLEIDFEKLWGGILKRGGSTEIERTEDETFEPVSLPEPVGQLRNRPLSILSQSRGFHTSARHLSPGLEREPSLSPFSPPLGEASSLRPSATQTELQDLQHQVVNLLESADYGKIKDNLRQYSGHTQQLPYQEWRFLILQQLKIYLESIPKDRAVEALGQGFTDYTSTPFLKCFYQALSDFPSQAEAEARIWLHSYAMDLGHKSYTSKDLMRIFRELRLFGVKIPREAYLNLIRHVLRAKEVSNDIQTYELPNHQIDEVMEILQTMYDQGHDIITEEILVELQKSSAPIKRPEMLDNLIYQDSTTFGLPSLPMVGIQHRLHTLIKLLDIHSFSDISRLQLLDLYSRQNHWREFWDIWNMAPIRGQPQSADMYTFMFFTIANTGNQKACMKVLRTWVSELDQEVPKVKLDRNIAKAIKACLKVADPYVEADTHADPKAKGEWISLWRRCTEAEVQA